MFVIPKQGLTIRDPETGRKIPSEGTEVSNTRFWRRRLQDGDVILKQIPEIKRSKKKNEKSEIIDSI